MTRVLLARREGRSKFRPRLRWMSRIPLISIVVLGGWVLVAILAGTLAPHDPLATSLRNRHVPPLLFGGSWEYPLGTDSVGRDILSRLIVGSRLSLLLAITSLGLGAAVGSALGIVSGYAGGRLDSAIMRLADMTFSIPIFLLALLLAAAIGPKISNVVIAIALVSWARFARVIRGEVLSIRERDYIKAAYLIGCPTRRIVARHLLPNVMPTILVLASLQLGGVILVEATLSYLGAGVPPPLPAWGSMVAQGRDYVIQAWWVSAMPGMAITLTILTVNFFGDWVRDVLDPYARS